jgi:hypothetical protein
VKKVPYSALAFGGTLAIDHTGELPEKPITITARTTAEAYQGYWGKCVHDMGGFIPPTGPIPLDYSHDGSEAIGLADTYSIDNGKLVFAGKLIPFKPDDNASKVIFQGSKGVPFQASIVMNPAGLQAEKIPEGKTVKVNGIDFSGPGTVFRKWGINGIAILPYGADSTTSVEFQRGKTDVEVFIKEAEPMTEEVKKEEAIKVIAEAIKPVESVSNFSREEAMKFKTDFGPAGFDWYLSGKSYEEAAKLFQADLTAKLTAKEAELKAKDEAIAKLEKERDDFKAKAEFKRGQALPVPVTPTDPETKKTDAEALAKRAMQFGRTVSAQAWVESVAAKMPTP